MPHEHLRERREITRGTVSFVLTNAPSISQHSYLTPFFINFCRNTHSSCVLLKTCKNVSMQEENFALSVSTPVSPVN